MSSTCSQFPMDAIACEGMCALQKGLASLQGLHVNARGPSAL